MPRAVVGNLARGPLVTLWDSGSWSGGFRGDWVTRYCAILWVCDPLVVNLRRETNSSIGSVQVRSAVV